MRLAYYEVKESEMLAVRSKSAKVAIHYSPLNQTYAGGFDACRGA